MPSKQSQKAVTAKMYRHFAVITLLVTGALALATDNNSADEFNAVVDDRQAQVASQGKDVKAYGEPKIVKRIANANEIPPAASGWGSDNFDLGFDEALGDTSSLMPDGMYIAKVTDGVLDGLGVTRSQFSMLSREEQEKLLRQATGGKVAVTAQEREQQIKRISDASRLRSGGGGSCSDC